jgi:hypothetical protein
MIHVIPLAILQDVAYAGWGVSEPFEFDLRSALTRLAPSHLLKVRQKAMNPHGILRADGCPGPRID